ncbi:MULTISPECIES: hypothetical protein [Providencia]|uniref:TRAFAC clade GTPase domain-containing protein n=1 Tax=Providencia TaxID=586 RepID=UPI00234B7736|nr:MULTISPECIES: hypothetical protein [Providencia]
MKCNDSSVLIIGESGVGKTHYGAQLLMKLQKKNAQLQMNGAAKNLEPFSEAVDKLNEGLAAKHTPAISYVESIWPIKDSNGFKGQLIWPDYGGEQVSNISTFRNIPKEWIQRVTDSTSWLFMLRTSLYRLQDDVLSRPINNEKKPETQPIDKKEMSDQARLIELIQILIYLRKLSGSSKMPKICLLLSCWDELNTRTTPPELLKQSLPMLYDFIHSHWDSPLIMGLSALGKNLDKINKDQAYVESGPESFGYVVCADGTCNPDITIPINFLIS